MLAIPMWVSWVAGGTCVGIASRRWDLSWCHGWDALTVGGEGKIRVWRLQLAGFEIFILLYRTPKRRRFDVVFFKKKN